MACLGKKGLDDFQLGFAPASLERMWPCILQYQKGMEESRFQISNLFEFALLIQKFWISVVEVGADQVGGGGGRPTCIKIGYDSALY